MKGLYLSLTITFVLLTQHTSDAYKGSYDQDDYEIRNADLLEVPANIGGDVQLRCTKITKHPSGSSHPCDPDWNEHCYHAWSKDGQVIENSGKFITNSIFSYDYCENFNGTTNLIKEIDPLIVRGEKDEWEYRNRELACLASVLTIRNVTLADLGQYQCNMSDHKNVPRYGYNNEWVQNVTLYNINDSPARKPESIQYFQKLHPMEMATRILVQCVASGGDLYWRMSVGETLFQSLEELKKQDSWQCFNHSIKTHKPFKDITESFLYLENVCRFDHARVWCSVGENNKSASAYIGEKEEYYNSYYYYDTEYAFVVTGFTVGSIVLVAVIVFGIVALVRAKVCQCCGGGNAVAHAYYQ